MTIPNEDTFYKDLADRIKTERLKRNLSQEDLAVKLDLTRASIINLEKGRHRPSIYQLITIASYFNVDYTVLIPIVIERQKKKTKAPVSDLDKMVIDSADPSKATKDAVLDFLTAIKK